MDYDSSFYLFDQTKEFIQISSLLDPYQEKITVQQQEKLLFTSSEATKQESKINLRRKATFWDTDNENPIEMKKKKAMHRDIERQRRQEMATLYKSLRAQFPLEHLKGRRSISDNMHEAVDYIKQLKKKIDELIDKKDGLTRICELNDSVKVNLDCSSGLVNSRMDDIFVTVSPCLVGVEVVIGSVSTPVSKVLEIMSGEGLNVVSCITTKGNEGLFHTTIESEVNDGRNINLSELQQNLMNLNRRRTSS